MPKVKADPIEEAENILGEPGEDEYTFLLVPVRTYALVSQIAREESCSVGEVFQKALLQYVRSAQGGHRSMLNEPARPQPDIVVRKRSR